MRHTKGARVRAARALGGYRSHKAFADALAVPNFGERTIRDVETDKRRLYDHERDAVARLVGVSAMFFEVDLQVDLEELRPRPLRDPETGVLSAAGLRDLLQQALAEIDEAAARAQPETTTRRAGTDRRSAGGEGGAA